MNYQILCEKWKGRHLVYMRVIFLVLIFLLTACRQNKEPKTKSSGPAETPIKASTFDCSDYAQKKLLSTKLLNDQAQETISRHILMTRFITDSIMPCWYGTAWDFNGCTRVPGKGSIACGYFVTTVLQDAGLKLNRIKLAQSPSSVIIHALCNNIKLFCSQPIANLVNAVKQNGKGLYIVGLDFHTGFIYCDGSEVYFIHSSYYGAKCVIKEKALFSAALVHSKYRQLGKINF